MGSKELKEGVAWTIRAAVKLHHPSTSRANNKDATANDPRCFASLPSDCNRNATRLHLYFHPLPTTNPSLHGSILTSHHMALCSCCSSYPIPQPLAGGWLLT